jgi:hypothetical protein
MSTPRYDAFELTDSAYRHGYHDEDVAEMLRGPHLVIRSRRGRLVGYEIFGRNRAGHYLLAAGRVVKYRGVRQLRVFHVNRMTDDERKRFRHHLRP